MTAPPYSADLPPPVGAAMGKFSGPEGRDAPYITRFFRRFDKSVAVLLGLSIVVTSFLNLGIILIVQLNSAVPIDLVMYWNYAKIWVVLFFGVWTLFSAVTFPYDSFMQSSDSTSKARAFARTALYNVTNSTAWIRVIHLIFTALTIATLVVLTIGTIYMSIFYLTPGSCALSPWCSVNNIMLLWFACEMIMLILILVLIATQISMLLMMFGYAGKQPWIPIYELLVLAVAFAATLVTFIQAIRLALANPSPLLNVFWGVGLFTLIIIVIYFLIFVIEIFFYFDGKWSSETQVEGIASNPRASWIYMVHFIRTVILYLLVINGVIMTTVWAMTIFEGTSCLSYTFCTLDRYNTMVAFIFQAVGTAAFIYFFTHVAYVFIAYLSYALQTSFATSDGASPFAALASSVKHFKHYVSGKLTGNEHKNK